MKDTIELVIASVNQRRHPHTDDSRRMCVSVNFTSSFKSHRTPPHTLTRIAADTRHLLQIIHLLHGSQNTTHSASKQCTVFTACCGAGR
mmetsp:Transcript_8168/g.23208  ORF Transcript_8168/g.23208 Transcript_8168/m.23208 type:complete len:89 (+) Transcript_8168:1656-1922(+)